MQDIPACVDHGGVIGFRSADLGYDFLMKRYWQLTVVVILVSWCWFSSLCAVYPLLLIECVFNVISRLIRVSSFGILTPSSHPLQSEGDLSFDGELFVTQEVSSAPLIQTTAVTGATPRSLLLQADPVLNLPGPSGDAGAVADVPPANVAVQPAAPPDVGAASTWSISCSWGPGSSHFLVTLLQPLIASCLPSSCHLCCFTAVAAKPCAPHVCDLHLIACLPRRSLFCYCFCYLSLLRYLSLLCYCFRCAT
ncbi:uncharacterized protein V6R79_020812 [Siganus canaliculatus]